ncbi:MAG: glycoside hydrolase family 2 protein, partial [Muribaculaceae bacterium]
MKKYIFFLIAILTVNLCMAREVKTINAGWEFRLGDDATADAGWQHVGLPHSFSLPYFMSKDFYVGYGWYRKTVKLTKKDIMQYVALEFDGVFQEAEVFVNGKKAGSHVGGYTGFEIDITPFAKVGDNEITVRVNNLWKATVAPRGGEHTFSGGIYRNVRLVKKNKAHIAWYGTRITTPTLECNNGSSSIVKAEIELEGLTNARPYSVEITISRNGEKITSRCSSPIISQQSPCNGRQSVVVIESPAIPNPNLWSPSSPALYTLTTRLYDGKKILDETTETFGFRWFTWTKDKGFFINGKHHFFRGANVHQDQAGWGDGVTDEASRRDVRMMKECGFDMIRGSHYPHSPAFSDECDRQGMLLWQEAPFWGTGGEKKDGSWTAGAYPGNKEHEAAFEQSALQQLEEMIRIHRNHPSIFVWSMSNEPFFTGWGTMNGVKRMLRLMVDKAHQLDPTRKAAVGGAQRPLGDDRIDLIGDVAGYNGDGANIADFQMPDVPSVVSEYGSTTAVRPGRYIPGWGDLARNEGYKGRSWRSGQAIWCGFDHGSIFGDALGRMGIVDYFRLPKRSW